MSEKSSSSSSSSGIGFFGLLTIVFVVMKLAEIGTVATWPWFWVLSPLLAGVAVWGALLVVFFVGFLLAKPR